MCVITGISVESRPSRMFAFKAFMASVEVSVAWILATGVDDQATRIALFAAAAAGLAWFWRNMLVPLAKVLHRLAAAVEALEDLPVWRKRTERRIKHLELGVGHIASGQKAMLRELGIEDKVRREFEGTEAFERWMDDYHGDYPDQRADD